MGMFGGTLKLLSDDLDIFHLSLEQSIHCYEAQSIDACLPPLWFYKAVGMTALGWAE